MRNHTNRFVEGSKVILDLLQPSVFSLNTCVAIDHWRSTNDEKAGGIQDSKFKIQRANGWRLDVRSTNDEVRCTNDELGVTKYEKAEGYEPFEFWILNLEFFLRSFFMKRFALLFLFFLCGVVQAEAATVSGGTIDPKPGRPPVTTRRGQFMKYEQRSTNNKNRW